jgi:hypothetical protein
MATLRELGGYGGDGFDAGRFIQLDQAGQRQRTLSELGQQASQGDLQGAEKTAWAGGQTDIAAALRGMNQDDHARLVQDTASFALSADTPEKWQAMGQQFAQAHPGFDIPPFQARQALIDRAVPVAEKLRMQQAQSNADRSYGLQEQTLEQGKVSPGYRMKPDGSGWEPIPGGPADPAQAGALASKTSNTQFDNISGLRKEVQGLPSYKNYAQAYPIVKAMADTYNTDSKASDLNLVYGLGKIFDPGSVVREGEMVMVKDTASLPDWLVGAIKGVNGGARLQASTRQAILRETISRANQYKQAYDQDASQYQGIADRYKINPADILPNFGEVPMLPGNLPAVSGGGDQGGWKIEPVQ